MFSSSDLEVSSPEFDVERRWSLFILDQEESLISTRKLAPQHPDTVYTENRRYFADQDFRRARQKPDQNMVEYWVPPDKNVKKNSNGQSTQPGVVKKSNQVCPTSATNGKRAMKIPKVKEPRGENSSKKSSADKAPSPFRVMYWKLGEYFGKVGEAVNRQYQKVRMFRNRMKANKVAPIHTKLKRVQTRHLELEPLCCLSSCLVRGGCTTVVVFELCYIVATALCIFEGMLRKKFAVWEPIPESFNGWFAHPLFYYAIALYDIVLFMMAIATARALVNFDKATLRAHYFFCFFSFFINVCFLIFGVWSLLSEGPLSFTPINCILIVCFICQLPLQIWAVTVVRSCRDFFALIHVFVSLAES